ncbi:hypothetical protein M8818_001549 [Zalaria obscura]|uniref:Uncharacterized protein n=1 Tax=Zalaria obscura TaxID=2024903 RepID=A0ACC3SK28_9PEZI
MHDVYTYARATLTGIHDFMLIDTRESLRNALVFLPIHILPLQPAQQDCLPCRANSSQQLSHTHFVQPTIGAVTKEGSVPAAFIRISGASRPNAGTHVPTTSSRTCLSQVACFTVRQMIITPGTSP